MTEEINKIILQLEDVIRIAEETDDKYEFIEPASKLLEKLNDLENSFEAIEPIFELIERSPDIDYGGPGPLGHFLETYYQQGYEELLIKSIDRKPTLFTLFLLHRLMNDKENPNHQQYFDIMKKISLSDEYPESIIEEAKDSLTYFE